MERAKREGRVREKSREKCRAQKKIKVVLYTLILCVVYFGNSPTCTCLPRDYFQERIIEFIYSRNTQVTWSRAYLTLPGQPLVWITARADVKLSCKERKVLGKWMQMTQYHEDCCSNVQTFCGISSDF